MLTTQRAGVYALVCVPTGERYIGATADLRKRRVAHFSALRCGTHRVTRLRELARRHGEGSFRWAVLESVPIDSQTDEALRAAELRQLSVARAKFGDRLLSRPTLLYNGKSRKGKTLAAIVDEFKRHCAGRGLNHRDELERVLRDYLRDARKTDR